MTDENKVDGIILVTEESRKFLNPRQEVTYQSHRRELCEWMLSLGKIRRRRKATATPP